MNSLEYFLLNCRVKVNSMFERVFKEEAGAAELVATLIIVGIVLILAFTFKDKLTELASSLWNSLIRDKDPNPSVPGWD